MNDFVDQCRREWKRLGVPDPLADEMAAELATDLREAEGEGVSVDELLGSSASDPGAFAAAWARERGIVPDPRQRSDRRTPRALVAFTALAGIAALVAALLLVTGEPKVSLTASGTGVTRPQVHQVQASAAAPIEWILLFVALAALAFAAWLWSRWGRSQLPVATAH
jgi:hypothetical protein